MTVDAILALPCPRNGTAGEFQREHPTLRVLTWPDNVPVGIEEHGVVWMLLWTPDYSHDLIRDFVDLCSRTIMPLPHVQLCTLGRGWEDQLAKLNCPPRLEIGAARVGNVDVERISVI
jgi:hypothetical protein